MDSNHIIRIQYGFSIINNLYANRINNKLGTAHFYFCDHFNIVTNMYVIVILIIFTTIGFHVYKNQYWLYLLCVLYHVFDTRLTLILLYRFYTKYTICYNKINNIIRKQVYKGVYLSSWLVSFSLMNSNVYLYRFLTKDVCIITNCV